MEGSGGQHIGRRGGGGMEKVHGLRGGNDSLVGILGWMWLGRMG